MIKAKLAAAVLAAGIVVWSTGPANAGSVVRIATTIGNIDLELYDVDKPKTVKNFLNYIRTGRYKQSFIHRLDPGFSVQGGGFFLDSSPEGASLAAVQTFKPIPNEFGLGAHYGNEFGTISMAKISGDPNSATSQWFFNLGDNDNLDVVNGGYTVFGKAISGIKVLKRFNQTFADSNKSADVISDETETLGPVFSELPLLTPSLQTDNLIYTNFSIISLGTTATLIPKVARAETTGTTFGVRGRARGDYKLIVWRVGSSGGFRKASGKKSWRFTAGGLKKGQNVIMVRALNAKRKTAAETRIFVTVR